MDRRAARRLLLANLTAVAWMAVLAVPASTETVELVTYYPTDANTGDLHVRSLTVGEAYRNQNPGDGEALIFDRLGIGTTAPGGPLEVVGVDDTVSPVILRPGADTAGAGLPDIRLEVQGGVFLQGGNGDVNADGFRTTVGDANRIGDYLNGATTLTAAEYARADITGDGQVTALDFELLVDLINRTRTIAQAHTQGKQIQDRAIGVDRDGNVGIGTAAPEASAALDVVSTTGGFLVPRMASAQRSAIASPATGLLVYQTDLTAGFYYYDGSDWIALSAARGGSTTQVVFGTAGSSSWTVPEGVTRITVEVWGGGGGGGGATGGRWSHGGGGGGYGKAIATVTPGSVLSITVGNGGRGYGAVSTDGATGGSSVVSGMLSPASITAIGGAGGKGNGHTSSNPAFSGGGTSTGPYNISGGRGNRIYGVVTSEGGDGANGGAGGVAMVDAGGSFRANPGVAPGGGGSGWWDYINETGSNDGAVGRVVITY